MFHNKRPVAKSRTRWQDVVLRNTSQILGMRGWRDEQKTEKNGATSDGGEGPEGAVAPQMERNRFERIDL